MYRVISYIILSAFLINTLGPVPLAQAQELRLPVPGVLVRLSPPENPPVLKGVTVYPNNPFKFDFILDKGDASSDLKQESAKLVKYFLASITTPENDLWVNLSPYEKNRIIPESFGQTDMGRDLLAEDYILKQITASLIYPEEKIGRQFWKRVYEEAAKKFGTTNIPVNTFNKVWIVPDHAKVYEHGNTAFVVQARLKVMLEQDYLSMQKHRVVRSDMASVGADIVREIVIPELEKEVNEGKNFATLRQVYYSLILAVWFKKRMKDSILGRKYMDQNKVSGIHYDRFFFQASSDTEFIYQRYLKAFKKGVYNYIKEEPDPMTQEIVPRKYFSGGWVGAFKAENIDFAQTINPSEIPDSDFARVTVDLDSAMAVPGSIVPRILFEMQLNLNREFNSKTISDNSKFDSFIEKGKGGEATIYVDPDPRKDDPKNFYKVFFGKFGPLGLRELRYLKILNGISGVPKVLDWGKMSKGGVWIHLAGIENAASIFVRDERGHSIYSEVWKNISPSQRLIALAEVAEILENAHHRLGIGHGDVKPGNIVISYDGKEVKVLLIDWGLAMEFGKKPFGETKGFNAPDKKMQDQTDTYALGETILQSLLVEGYPSTSLQELCARMKLTSPDERPSLTEVAGKLREFAREKEKGDHAQLAAPLSRPDPAVVFRLAQIESELKRELVLKKSLRPRYFGSYTRIGGGATANIYLDPNDPKRFYKVSLYDSGYMDELKTLKMLKGIPGIPQLLDWGVRSDGRVWMHLEGIRNAMGIEVEVRNKSFASEVWKKFSLSQRLDKIAKVARILEAAHQRGISHNDVKPGNIIVNEQGEVMVIDWGIATALGERQKASTRLFAAPEEIKVDQSDVYSLIRSMDYLHFSYPLDLNGVETELKNLRLRMSNENADQRPSMKEVADIMGVLAQKAAMENGESVQEDEDSFRSSNITADTAMTSLVPDPRILKKLDGIEIKLHRRFLALIEKKATLPEPDFGTPIGHGWQANIYNDPDPRKQGQFYKVFKQRRDVGIRELRNLIALQGLEGVPRVTDDDWGLDKEGDVWIHMQGIKNAAGIEIRDEQGNLHFSDAWSRLSFSRQLNVISKVADILQAAHQAGISHNDITPENIIFNIRGEVMVIDWANAKALGERQILGNGQFSAPEEIKQDQSDVYGLGKTMYYSIPSILKDTKIAIAARNLYDRMAIKKNPDNRLTMKEAAAALKVLAQNAAAENRDSAQLSGIVQPVFPTGTLNHVFNVRQMVDKLKGNPIVTAYYPGIGSDFKAAFDITDANIIVGVDESVRTLWALKSSFGEATNVYVKQETDLEGRQRAIIGFVYKGKRRKMILYNGDINILTADKIPELKDGYDFLFLKALPIDSYTHDFVFESLSLLKENGLVFENTLEKGLNHIEGKVSDFPILKERSIGSLIDSYKEVTHGLSIWKKTAPGGIDLTASRMKLEVDPDKASVSQPMDLKALENIEINGLYIKDIEVKPLKDLPQVLGVSAG
jgi:serine/threonine protein kinase